MAGGFYFFGLMAVISALALNEFYALARAKGSSPQVGVGALFGLCFNAAFIFDRLKYGLVTLLASIGRPVPLPTMTQLLLILILVFVMFVLVVELFRKKNSAVSNIATTLLGVCYVSLFLGSLVGLRELFVPGDFPVYRHFNIIGVDVPANILATLDRWGGLTVATIFASIWVCDSAAYFIGRAWGRHKLWERVSPHKTWEGAIAGSVAAVATFVASRALFLDYMTLGSAIVCGVIVGLFGQIGDMVESMLKRDAGVKDSSSLIPGHGGVLDRFDSLLFVSPLIYLYLDFIVF
jgi:phosphatidate cytidylyltransferase